MSAHNPPSETRSPSSEPDAFADAAPGRPDAEAAAAPLEDALAAVSMTARRVDGTVRSFVVRRPVVALVGALAGGFLIGRILSRA